MSDPEKSYHFEIVCASMGKAQQIQKIMRCFALDAKIVSRKKTLVVYLKEGAQIVDVLNVMEASVTDGVGEYPYIERYEEYGEPKK